jgi:predicted nucleic acid-binding protein
VRIYFDACTLNRLTDDQRQPRILAEAEAVEQVLDLVTAGKGFWIASSALRAELERNPNEAKRAVSLVLLTFASEFIEPNEATFQRASALAAEGFGSFDALHLALAEQAQADCLLTTDDRFLALAARAHANLLPSVLNPVDWWNRRSQWLLQPESTR